MEVIPSLYLKSGQCVYPCYAGADAAAACYPGAKWEIVSDDPIDQAGRWMDQGAKALYVYDIDGALSGEPVHQGVVSQIALRFPNFKLHLGGGIRQTRDLLAYQQCGVNSMILGSAAADDLELLDEASSLFPGQLSISLETWGETILTQGHRAKSELTVKVWMDRLAGFGLGAIFFNDVQRECLGKGVNLKRIVDLVNQTQVPVYVSGGVNELRDIQDLAPHAFKGIAGVLPGSALYTKSLDLLEAQQFCDNADRF